MAKQNQFNVVRLQGKRALVSGTDAAGTVGQVVVDTTQWDEIATHQDFVNATEKFDAVVEEHFATISAAADELSKALEVSEDPATFVVLHPGTEGVEAVEEVRVSLTKDSIILNLVEAGDYDRLIWVNGELEVLEVLATA